jgi:hypothetical protein
MDEAERRLERATLDTLKLDLDRDRRELNELAAKLYAREHALDLRELALREKEALCP